MKILFLIILNVIVPVFILIGAGVFLHRKFHFDLNTLSKLITYFQSFLTNTYGVFNSVSANHKGSAAIVQFLKVPVIYALLLGLLLHSLEVKIPSFIWKPIENVADAFLAIALLTLGAQVAHLKITRPSLPLSISIFGRLALSPMIALIFIFILGIKGTVAQALFIASSYPASRNMALLALEYDNYPEYAAQAVLLSTLFSSITVTIVVYLSRILF
ncbi:AEC family transporter [Thermolongibacillus altinsuensis]|uniref:AEC family transporter n=1 Tax=Thermolongibacillus altinsuensis TaxID=575256 RepID=UPI00242A32E7|nr:AEC family transporter [Thermolongibacillus altinsuensis]GMB08260.1 hypothetical protein B1no1_09700 [Thermolongibacillus altinsuensis]